MGGDDMTDKTYPMAFVTAPGVIEFLPHEPGTPLAPQEVRLAVQAAAICGSDLHIFKGKHPSAPLPVSVGHELAGEVIETGPAVTKIKPRRPRHRRAGDRLRRLRPLPARSISPLPEDQFPVP